MNRLGSLNTSTIRAVAVAIVATTLVPLSLPAHAAPPPACERPSCWGIRPGAPLVSPSMANPLGLPVTTPAHDGLEYVGCTMGFLVTDGRRVFVSTAGHCVSRAGVGGRVTTAAPIGEFGTVRYLRCRPPASGEAFDCDTGFDFALVEIDRDKLGYADPQVTGWAEPDTIFRDARQGDHTVRHSGWGVGVSSTVARYDDGGKVVVDGSNPATHARQGVMLQADEDSYAFTNPLVLQASGGGIGGPEDGARVALVRGAIDVGDSGGPVLVVADPLAPATQRSRTRALGSVSQLTPNGATVERLDVNLELASRALHRSFDLWHG